VGQPAARLTDNVLQQSPHCHAPIHPPAPTPTPVPHPALPLMITGPGAPTVMIASMPASIMNDMTMPCMLPGCVPGGPGQIMMGSTTVFITNQMAARLNDPTLHSSCVAPIPGPNGSVMGPGAPTVLIGG